MPGLWVPLNPQPHSTVLAYVICVLNYNSHEVFCTFVR